MIKRTLPDIWSDLVAVMPVIEERNYLGVTLKAIGHLKKDRCSSSPGQVLRGVRIRSLVIFDGPRQFVTVVAS